MRILYHIADCRNVFDRAIMPSVWVWDELLALPTGNGSWQTPSSRFYHRLRFRARNALSTSRRGAIVWAPGVGARQWRVQEVHLVCAAGWWSRRRPHTFAPPLQRPWHWRHHWYKSSFHLSSQTHQSKLCFLRNLHKYFVSRIVQKAAVTSPNQNLI